jgi:DNA-binding beta-propeller fold protein YncE
MENVLLVEGAPTVSSLTGTAGFAYVTRRASHAVTVIDANALTTVGEAFRVGPVPFDAALDDKAERLYVVCLDSGALAALDARTGSVLERFPVGGDTMCPRTGGTPMRPPCPS